MSAVLREFRLLARDRGVWLWLALALALSTLAAVSGVHEVRAQRVVLEEMRAADRAERMAASAGQTDWGGIAYYSFHLTYAPPSSLTYLALGQRDAVAWKHRIRMLALEGQIHESDATHPELALIGRFDFAFVASLLAPLLVILLLHDLRAGERAAGRYELLCASAAEAGSLWRLRAMLRVALLALALLLPPLIAGLVEGSPLPGLLQVALIVIAHLLFWTVVCALLDPRPWTGPVKLTGLLGLWLLLAVLLPAALRPVIERAHPLPDGAEILLTQREAVNDAWDLPKEVTMQAFVARHPEWAAHAEISRPFEWKWYYAFQQVGDQQASSLSRAYREGRAARDALAATLAWLSPPSLVQRSLQGLAGTDVAAMLAYEDAVRDFHGRLRGWYYPLLFQNAPLDRSVLARRPDFEATAVR